MLFNRLVYERTKRKMNIRKSIDRISLAIAIIVLIPGFYYGRIITKETFKTVLSPGYTEVLPLNPKKTYRNSPPIYKYPPMWKSLTGGIVIALSGFFVVLFVIRGTARLFIWITEGFMEEKK